MFFMMGITEGQKIFDFVQNMVCDACGRYGRYEVYMTYTVLSLFFIPVFKWNKRYFVRTSCCHKTYELNPEVGKRIAKGEQVTLDKEDFINTWEYESYMRESYNGYSGYQNPYKKCKCCGYETEEDFKFCPKCSTPFTEE